MSPKEYVITVKDTKEEFSCRENEVILEAMKRSAKGPVRCGCFGGGCGICKMRVFSGQIHQSKRMSREHVPEDEEKNGTALLCCIHPRSDITIGKA